MANHGVKLDTLKDCLQFLEWLRNSAIMKGRVANRLGRLLQRMYISVIQRDIEPALDIFLTDVHTFHNKLCNRADKSQIKRINAIEALEALIQCIPKLLSAIYFLQYQVNKRFDKVGGGKWANQQLGMIGLYARFHIQSDQLMKRATDIEKYFIARNGSDYGVIPGGFGIGELKENNQPGYSEGHLMVTDLIKIFDKESNTNNIFRDVFVTSVVSKNPSVDISNVANALRLVEDFCGIFGGVEGEQDFKNNLQARHHCISWQDLKQHCTKIKKSLEHIFKGDKYFSFTGYARTYGKLRKEDIASKMAKWLKQNLEEIRGRLKITSSKLDANMFATTYLFPYGFTFNGYKFGESKDPYKILKADWDRAMKDLTGDEGLQKLKKILDGNMCQPENEDEESESAENDEDLVDKEYLSEDSEDDPIATETEAAKPVETKSQAKQTATKAEGAQNQGKKVEGAQNQGKKGEITPPATIKDAEHTHPPSAQSSVPESPGATGSDSGTGPSGQGDSSGDAQGQSGQISYGPPSAGSGVSETVSGGEGKGRAANLRTKSPTCPVGQSAVRLWHNGMEVCDPRVPVDDEIWKAQQRGMLKDVGIILQATPPKPEHPHVSNMPSPLSQPSRTAPRTSHQSTGGRDSSQQQPFRHPSPSPMPRAGSIFLNGHEVEPLGPVAIMGNEVYSLSQITDDYLREQQWQKAHQTAHNELEKEKNKKEQILKILKGVSTDVKRSRQKLLDDAKEEAERKNKLDTQYKDAMEYLRRDYLQREKDAQALQKKLDDHRRTQEEELAKLQTAPHPILDGSEPIYTNEHATTYPSEFLLSLHSVDGTVLTDRYEQEKQNERKLHSKHAYDILQAQRQMQIANILDPQIKEMEAEKRDNERFKDYFIDQIGSFKTQDAFVSGSPIKSSPPPPVLCNVLTLAEGTNIVDPRHIKDDENRKLQLLHANNDFKNYYGRRTETANEEAKRYQDEVTRKNSDAIEAVKSMGIPQVFTEHAPRRPSPILYELPDFDIQVPKHTLPNDDSDFDLDFDDDSTHIKTETLPDSVDPTFPAISFNLPPPDVGQSMPPRKDFDPDIIQPPTVQLCISSWATSTPTPGSTNIPETELFPAEVPRTVRDMLTWLAGLKSEKHHDTLEKCINKAFSGLHKDPSLLAIFINHAKITPTDVFEILQLTAMFAGSVLTSIAPNCKANATSKTVKPKSFNDSEEPDCCALLCQLRDYVYACHHQLQFLKSQCNRDKLSGGWKSYDYGYAVSPSDSPLQSFLTDGWDSTFETHPFDPCNLCLKSRIWMGFKTEDLPEIQQTGSTLSIILTPSCGGEEREPRLDTKW